MTVPGVGPIVSLAYKAPSMIQHGFNRPRQSVRTSD
jgi:hypothetical protein